MKEIIFTGRLTKDRLKELYGLHFGETKTAIKDIEDSNKTKDPDNWNPLTDKNIISLVRQKDGNWKGYGFFQGQNKTTRSYSPEMCLQGLLTGHGEIV